MTSSRFRFLTGVLTALAIAAPARVHAAACGGSTMACGTATSVTYNGSALTFAGASTNGTVRTEIWYLKAPTAGSHSVVVTAPVASDVTASSISFTGVDQTTPVGTFVSNLGTGTTAAVVATTAVGDPVVDIVGAVTTTAPTIAGTTQTLRNTNNTSSGVNHIVSGQSTAYGQAAPITMSWTTANVDWAIAALPIKASTALTGIDVDSFTATWHDGGTFLQWRSGYQPDTVGYSVYRSNGSGPRTLLNRDLIEGGALEGTLSMFDWTDTTAGWNGDVSYWLKEVREDGSSRWFGPASPVPPPVVEPVTPGVVSPAPDAGADTTGAGGAGGASSAFGGATGSPGAPAEVASSEPQGGCTIVSRGRPVNAMRLFLLAGVVWSARRRRRRGVIPALFLALLLASGLWTPRHAAATGGVAVDATATATGASGLTFAHVMGAGANGLLVVGIVTPVTCIDTTTDSGNCGTCGSTCSLDTTSLTTGLVGLWHFDEGSGVTSADASGNGNTATFGTSGASWTTGYSQNAVQFNGTATSYGQAPLGAIFGTNTTLSASAWVYVTANTNGPVFGVTSIPSGGGWNMPFLSIKGGVANATVYGWTWNNTALSTTVSLNAWHMLTLTYDPSGTVTKLYVDGGFISMGAGIYSASGLVDYWTTNIGGAKPAGVNSQLLGRIDEVRAYSRVLSAAEVTALYTARLGCAASTCAACGSGKTSCSGSCVVTATDDNNCGGCGHACNTANGETCSGGICVCSNMALSDCSTYCVDETTDPSNCGACGTVCSMSTPAFVDASLLGRWKLDDNTGVTAADASGNGRTATFSPTPPTWVPGYSGSGLSFNGASNYLNATLGTWFGGNNTLTASAWVYATATTNGPIFGVTDTAPGGGWNMPFLSIAGATAYGHIWMVNGNVALSHTVSLNNWHHLAITYDPSAGEKFYVDGALAASGTGTFSPSGRSDTWTTYIPGTKPAGVNTYLNGKIDDVRAYTRVLSAAEIAVIYDSRQSCTGSACGGCGGSAVVCGGACTDKTVDPDNCGACGTVCNAVGGETCVASACGCASGMDCSGTCYDTTTDNNHCGGCSTVCGTTTCTSCSEGLVGLWHLDEGSGSTSADASGNGRTATLVTSPTWTAGQTNDGLSFNGTSYLEAPLGGAFASNATLSAAVWVYATSTTNGPVFGVTNVAGAGSWDMPLLSVNGATVYGWLWQVNGNTPLSATVSLNAWHFLAITYDPAVGEKFYVDGALSSSAAGTFAPSGGVIDYWTTKIPGATPGGVNKILTGLIDEARAYSRVLSAGEIKLLYDSRQSCVASSCNGCPAGTTLCSAACTNTLADKNNCNACGTVCPGAQTCVAGTCM